MKRLLVVAGDRALTRFVAEALLDRPLEAPRRPSEAWEVARAHTALEAHLLVTRGGRPFDILLLDQTLPDQDISVLLGRLRASDEAASVPIFLLSERGRDPHFRRVASERLRVAGFIEKPVSAESLREALDGLERRRRVLVVESHPELGERHRDVLEHAGYLPELVRSGREALDRAPRLRPDLVVVALILDDLRGIEVCVELKRAPATANIPVVLHGQMMALADVEIAENAHRADDFIQAPFDDEMLVERVAALIGHGHEASKRWRRSSRLVELAARAPLHDPDPTDRRTQPPQLIVVEEEVSEPAAPPPANAKTPPPSASPSPVAPARRTTRRVPCSISMSVKNGERVYTSKTLDISHGGIFLETDEPIEIGTRIDMTFQIPNSDRAVNAVGKVAWAGHGGSEGHGVTGVGVKFSRIDPADLQLIVDYVNRVSRVVYSAS